jgi:hypothetical protein
MTKGTKARERRKEEKIMEKAETKGTLQEVKK